MCGQFGKGYLFLRDDETVTGRCDDGYQIYSFQLEQALVGYYLSRLNKF